MRYACKLTFLPLLILGAIHLAAAEDQDLRNRAVHLLDRAQLASHLSGPTNIRTEVTFNAVLKGTAQQGTYTRVRSANGGLREDVSFGDFHASSIEQQNQVAEQGPWSNPPYAVQRLMDFVPYSPLSFDETDVIQSLNPGSVNGQQATCVQFVTIRGDDRNPGEICVSDANSTVLEWHDSRRSWQASEYVSIKGALLPSNFTYREGDTFSLTADVKFTLLDAEPSQELAASAEWKRGTLCKTVLFPVVSFSPQPSSKGGAPNAPVIDVTVHATVTAQGAVTGAEVLKPVRPDLDADAIKLASTWRFTPGNCEGSPKEFPIDITIHFQGR